MRIHPVPCRKDNYAYLVVSEGTRESAIVDASEAAPVISRVRELGLEPRDIWATHHHHDHVGGNEEVVKALGIRDVIGHVSDNGRIPGQTKLMETGSTFNLGDLRIRTLHIPGHTLGAIAYIVTDGSETAVFTGDTLFFAGCGRLFEGTPEQMHHSLASLAALGPDVTVYCGHEYTEANLRFAKHVEPGNRAIDRTMERIRALRAEGRPSVPSTIAEEKQVNPFLRVNSPEIRETVGIAKDADDVTAFAAIRKAKDEF